MWVFTPEGFYSVVTAEEFGEELQVPGPRRRRSRAPASQLVPRPRADDGEVGADTLPGLLQHADQLGEARADGACHRLLELQEHGRQASRRRPCTDLRQRVGRLSCHRRENRTSTRDNKAESARSPSAPASTSSVTSMPRGSGLLRPTRATAGSSSMRTRRCSSASRRTTSTDTCGRSRRDPGIDESSAQTALREVFEETGLRPCIVGRPAPGFSGTATGWMAYFYLMVDLTGTVDEEAVARTTKQPHSSGRAGKRRGHSSRRRPTPVGEAAILLCSEAFNGLYQLLALSSEGI